MKAEKKKVRSVSQRADVDNVVAPSSEIRGTIRGEMFEPICSEKSAVMAFLNIYHVADLLNKTVERSLAPDNLSVARYAILRVLAGREPMPLSWVAEKHFSRRSNITAMVDRLVRDGLVERLDDAIDRRVVRVGMTLKGQQTLDKARGPHLQQIAELMSPLTTAEHRTLIDLLGKLAAPLDNPDKN